MRVCTGIIKSIFGEITDHTNSSDAFAMLHVPWAIGGSFGYEFTIFQNYLSQYLLLQIHSALIGGSLARPHDHFPEIFSSRFWINYPYFLPLAVLAVITIMGLTVTAVYLNEVGKFLGNCSKINSYITQSTDSKRRIFQSTRRRFVENR